VVEIVSTTHWRYSAAVLQGRAVLRLSGLLVVEVGDVGPSALFGLDLPLALTEVGESGKDALARGHISDRVLRVLPTLPTHLNGPSRWPCRPYVGGSVIHLPREVDDTDHIATPKRMKADGHTGRDIASYLGVSRATAYRYLDDSPAA
jgi:hypothetical protein